MYSLTKKDIPIRNIIPSGLRNSIVNRNSIFKNYIQRKHEKNSTFHLKKGITCKVAESYLIDKFNSR